LFLGLQRCRAYGAGEDRAGRFYFVWFVYFVVSRLLVQIRITIGPAGPVQGLPHRPEEGFQLVRFGDQTGRAFLSCLRRDILSAIARGEQDGEFGMGGAHLFQTVPSAHAGGTGRFPSYGFRVRHRSFAGGVPFR
jgi:hypothetical protein